MRRKRRRAGNWENDGEEGDKEMKDGEGEEWDGS